MNYDVLLPFMGQLNAGLLLLGAFGLVFLWFRTHEAWERAQRGRLAGAFLAITVASCLWAGEYLARTLGLVGEDPGTKMAVADAMGLLISLLLFPAGRTMREVAARPPQWWLTWIFVLAVGAASATILIALQIEELPDASHVVSCVPPALALWAVGRGLIHTQPIHRPGYVQRYGGYATMGYALMQPVAAFVGMTNFTPLPALMLALYLSALTAKGMFFAAVTAYASRLSDVAHGAKRVRQTLNDVAHLRRATTWREAHERLLESVRIQARSGRARLLMRASQTEERDVLLEVGTWDDGKVVIHHAAREVERSDLGVQDRDRVWRFPLATMGTLVVEITAEGIDAALRMGSIQSLADTAASVYRDLRADRVERFHAALSTLWRAGDDELYETAVQIVQDHLPAGCATVYLSDGDRLVFRAASTGLSSDLLAGTTYDDVADGTGLSVTTFRECRPLRVAEIGSREGIDMEKLEALNEARRAVGAKAPPIRSWLGVPIGPDCAYGVLEVCDREPWSLGVPVPWFSGEDEVLVERVASLLAQRIQNRDALAATETAREEERFAKEAALESVAEAERAKKVADKHRAELFHQKEAAEAATKRASEQAERAELLARKQQVLMSTLAHELRAPMQVIRLKAQVWQRAERKGTLPAVGKHSTREVFDRIVERAKLFDHLFDDWQQVVKIVLAEMPVVPRTVRVRQMFSDIVAGLEEECEQAHAHVVVLCRDDIAAFGDEAALRHAVSNLVSNAVKYGVPRHGDVVRLTADVANGRVTIRVSDQGPGISEAEEQRIFELFKRGKAATAHAPGAGVGLYLVRAITEAHHDATLRLVRHSELGRGEMGGRGVTFELELPEAA